MKIVFHVEGSNFGKANDIVLKNDILSRQSITFKDAKLAGLEKEGYCLIIDGSEEAISEARKLLKDLVTEVVHKERDKVLEILQKEEESANVGFGSIFG